ncbi:hypothetical protein SBF1_50027 [Candidatus Desulfosporosinus infrequens]|uniref:Uncharacterized protein n=1 Tax=Candidatus Desulfosporosinus infrequens TaxID=2043169 RepID=A0A2U3LGW8_9FIRM|nr:hypothetical protein SBF1_50027 [Candidatus Desulfosporosinus infrequens]
MNTRDDDLTEQEGVRKMGNLGKNVFCQNKRKESVLLDRRGTFSISQDLLQSNPEGVVEVLRDVLVVAVENDFMTRSMIYRGYSNRFDLLGLAESTPTYNVQVQESNDAITVTWRREKEYSERDVKSMLEEINKKMSFQTNYIISTATIMNSDTLVLKLGALLRCDDIERLRNDLQSQCPNLKVMILPYAVDIANDTQ